MVPLSSNKLAIKKTKAFSNPANSKIFIQTQIKNSNMNILDFSENSVHEGHNSNTN